MARDPAVGFLSDPVAPHGAGVLPAGEAVARVREVFARQQAGRWALAARDAPARAKAIGRFRDAVLARRQELFDAMRSDFRKSPFESEISELQPFLVESRTAMRRLGRWMRARPVRTPWHLFGTRSEIRHEPKGVVLLIAPWNYPFGLVANPLVASIAAGNATLILPSEKTPATALFLESVIRSVFDESQVAVIRGGVPAATAALELPFDHIFFTGSTRVGRLVAETAAKQLVPVTLELGGKTPVIVDESADIARAARAIAWGKFLNGGQTCIAPDYVLVPESKERELVEVLRAALVEFCGPAESDRRGTADYCRVVDEPGWQMLEHLVHDSIRHGAVVEAGGVFDRGERYVSPTILSGVRPGQEILEREIFGPVLPLVRYRTLEEAIEFVRARPKPLALYVFARDAARVEQVLSGTTAGASVVNDVLLHYANPNLPFGGVGESGVGSCHGEFGFRALSHERAVMRQGPFALSRLFHPPYSPRKQALVRLLTRMLG